MSARSKKLTKRTVDACVAQSSEYVVWDTEIAGFGLRVFPTGRRSYIYKYRVGGGRSGTVRKPLIGTHGSLTPDQARNIARDWAAEVRAGGDPGTERSKQRSAPTTSELLCRYMVEHARPHKKQTSADSDQSLIDAHIGPALGRIKVAEIERTHVHALHQSLEKTPYLANRVLALISKTFNLAELWGLRPDGTNPCRHVRKFKEARRERFLSQLELAQLGGALAAAENGELKSRKGARLAPGPIAIIRLLIFTGARKSEIRSMRWDEVNLPAGRIELSDSKTGAKHIYLPPAAVQILSQISRKENNPYVFVGQKPGTHIVNIEDAWRAIREHAQMPDLRIHDLRHSFASVGAAGGMSLQMIGALLGHREVATTARYAHLSADPIRLAADQIGQEIELSLIGGEKNGQAV